MLNRIQIFKKVNVSYKEEGEHFPAAVINSSEDAANFVRQFYKSDISLYETCFVLFLDKHNNTLAYHKASLGSRYLHILDLDLVVELAIKLSAWQIILVHNHPTFFREEAGPSDGDIELTTDLKKILDGAGIIFRDHIILYPYSYYSFYDERGSFLKINNLNEKRIKRIITKEKEPRINLCKEIKYKIVDRDNNFPVVKIENSEDAIDFVQKKFSKEIAKKELYFILCMDEKGYTMAYIKVSKHLKPGLYSDSLKIARLIEESSTSQFYVIHTYPIIGEAKPMEVDVDFVESLNWRVDLMNYVINDYIILTKNNYLSFDKKDLFYKGYEIL